MYLFSFFFVCVCVLCCCCCCLFSFCYLSWIFFGCLLSFLFCLYFPSFFSGHSLWLVGPCVLWAVSPGPPGWEHQVQETKQPKYSQTQNSNQHALCWRHPSQNQNLASPKCLQAPVLDFSHKTTSKTGSQTHHLMWLCPSGGSDLAIPTRAKASVPCTNKSTQAPGQTASIKGQTKEPRENMPCRKENIIKASQRKKITWQRNTLWRSKDKPRRPNEWTGNKQYT